MSIFITVGYIELRTNKKEFYDSVLQAQDEGVLTRIRVMQERTD